MASETQERDWVEEVGRPCYESLSEMVAALECDYDRLGELRDERDGYVPDDAAEGEEEAAEGEKPWSVRWAEEYPDDAAELAELEATAGECGSREDAEQRIQEDALSVEVRSDWTAPGGEMEPGEFCILLSTGGPASRIVGDLDEHAEPTRARLEVQDWFEPWTEYVPASGDVLLAYARCFYFGG